MADVVLLVLARDAAPLQGLLDVLDGRFQVIVHLDAKCGDVPDRLRLPDFASMTPVRHKVFWGGFNMIRAIREMIAAAYAAAPGFRRLALITGDTLPVVPLDRLEQALLDPAREFIDLIEVPDDPSLRHATRQDAEARHDWVQPWRFQNHVAYDDELLSPRSREEAMRLFGLGEPAIDHLRGATQRIAADILQALPPRPKLFPRLFYGNSWWALSRQAMDLIVDDVFSDACTEYFRFLEVPDEHMFQTLLGNRARALESLGRAVAGSPVFVDHASPVRASFGRDALTLQDFRAAHARTGALFARKYDPAQAPDVATSIAAGRYFEALAQAA